MTLFINQSDNNINVGAFGTVKNNVQLFKVTDINHNGIIDAGDSTMQVQLSNTQIVLGSGAGASAGVGDGDVTINFTPDAIGSLYVVSVKYDTNSVVKSQARLVKLISDRCCFFCM